MATMRAWMTGLLVIGAGVPAMALGCGIDTNRPLMDAGADANDAGTTDAGTVEGDASCRLGEPFGALIAEPTLSSGYSDDSVRITPDRLEAYVSRRTAVDFVELFRYRRASVDAAWQSVGMEPLLSKYSDGGRSSGHTPTFSADGLQAIYQYYEDNTGHGSLFLTTRATPDGAWSAPAPAAGLESNASDEAPWWSQDGTTLWFFSDRQTYEPRIYTAERVGNGFAAPQRIPALGIDNESYPVVTADKLTMYFATRVLNTMEVRRATRASTSEPFGNVVPVKELNLDNWKTVPSWITPDGCVLYVVGNRPTSANGGFDVYRAEKPAR